MPRRQAQFQIVSDFPARDPVAEPRIARLLAGLTVSQASASIYACTPAWRIALMRQRQDMLLVPLAGRGRIAVNGGWFSVAQGRAIYATRGSWLQAETDPAAPFQIIILAHRADACGGIPFAVAAGLPAAIQLRDADGVVDSLVAACREDAQRVAGWQVAVMAHVHAALVALIRRAADRCTTPSAPAAKPLARIGPALAVMGLELSQPLPIAELALSCSLGQVQFRRLFRAAMGYSPVAHLHRLRLEQAQRLLAGGMPAREVAEAVGYRSTACLDRLFRKLAGTTPGRWRANLAAKLARSRRNR